MIKTVEEGLKNYKKAVREYQRYIKPYLDRHGEDFERQLDMREAYIHDGELSKLTAIALVLNLTEDEMESVWKEVSASLEELRPSS